MNVKEEKVLVDISKPKKDFDLHLSQPFNERIIFSGGFGTGKTFFLNKYFKESDKYEVIHLFPVNYSIASNEDIFELMKYDIGFELLKKNLDFEKISFDKLFTAQFFLLNNFKSILDLVLEKGVKMGKALFPQAETLLNFYRKFEEKRLEFEQFHNLNSKDQEKELITYLKNFTTKAGSIYEEDNITLLIKELVAQLKNSGKEVVLIIDDLDRIDPEHIFRLLNVFSAHFDINVTTGNKFDFDKIILVCDVENIRNIFHAKYGMKVDFTGYIDKFYSKEIFRFDNIQVVADSIKKLLATIEMEEKDAKIFPFKENRPDRIANHIHYILQGMVQANAINLRSLIKLDKARYKIHSTEIYYGTTRKYTTDIEIIVILNFLKFVLGSEIALSMALQKCSQLTTMEFRDIYDDYNKDKLGSLIAILDITQHELKSNPTPYPYGNEQYNFKVYYRIERDTSSRSGLWVNVSEVDRPGNIKYFPLLEETYKRIISLNMLK